MDPWEEAAARWSAGEPAKRDGDVWSAAAKRYAMPDHSIASQIQKPDGANPELKAIVAGMPALEKRRAQLGSGIADLVMGAKQLFGSATTADVDEKRKFDAALNNDIGGKALNFAGNVIPTLAVPTGVVSGQVARFAPSIAPVAEGAAQGALASFLQPVGKGESRGFNTAVGAAGGSIIPGLMAAYRGAAGKTTTEAAALAKKAIDQYNIPLQASDLTDSKTLKAINSIASDMPITGGIANARTEAKRVAFNRGVARTFGEDADKITPDVSKKAYDRMQGVYDDIYSRNPADMFQIQKEMSPVLQRTMKEGTVDQQRLIQNRYSQLVDRIDDNGFVDGNFFNRWQSDLRKAAGNDDLLSSFRKSALTGYNNTIGGEDAAILGKNNAQYRNYKIVEPLIEKAATGDIQPSLLLSRVASNVNDFSRGGGGDLGDLARIGKQFMVDRVPQTGGSARAFLQNGAIATGAGIGGAIGGMPGAAIGAATPVAGIGALSALMNNNGVRNSIMNKAIQGPTVQRGLLDAGAQAPEMLSEIFRRGALESLPATAATGYLSF